MHMMSRAVSAWILLAGLLIAPTTVTAQEFRVETRKAVQYGTHDGTALIGDLYLPEATENRPAIVAVHGGGFQLGSRDIYRYMGPYLAARGYALFSIDYRLTRDDKNHYPNAVNDVRAAVQWMRSRAADLKIDASRIALMGDSAGAYLAALVALAGDANDYANAYRDDAYASVSTKVKAVVGVYGSYDLIAQWKHDLISRPTDNITQNFMGFPPMQDRRAWFAASPMAHATFANNSTAFLLAWGTDDDIVEPSSQSEAFLTALKQARFYVRTVVVPSAPHFWMSDPVEETGSFTGFLAPRLLRFLAQRL
jgi:acetyl esterase/lipase